MLSTNHVGLRLKEKEEKYLAQHPNFTKTDRDLFHGTFVAYVFYFSSLMRYDPIFLNYSGVARGVAKVCKSNSFPGKSKTNVRTIQGADIISFHLEWE